MSDYPEHDKMAAIKDKSQAIGEFLEWLNENGKVIASYDPDDSSDELLPDYINTQSRLATYFDIDLGKIEAEKRAMLELMRAANDQG